MPRIRRVWRSNSPRSRKSAKRSARRWPIRGRRRTSRRRRPRRGSAAVPHTRRSRPHASAACARCARAGPALPDAPPTQGERMTITLKPGATVMFTGDSITDCLRRETEDGLGFGYPQRVAGEWGLKHTDRPVTWLNTGIGGERVMDLERRWRTDVLDAAPDLVSVLAGINDVGWHSYDPNGRVIPVEEFAAGYDRLLAPLAEAGTRL